MAAPRRRQSASEDEGGGANWMDTYGDLVTLLLCFFVLLFSFSSVDAKKWEALVGAFSGSTAVAIPGLTPEQVIEKPITLIARSSGDQIMKNKEDGEDGDDGEGEYVNKDAYLNWIELQKRLSEFLESNRLSIKMVGDRDRYSVTLSVGDNVFFNSGDASLLPEALTVLDKLTEFLKDNEYRYVMVTIEGHTDNVPINTSQYPSNWELSSLRAVNTLHYIADKGILDPDKLSVSGYSEYHPVDTNDTEAGKAANRRVDFVIQGVTEFETEID
ncbi:MAG: OmpA family protein [Oscillospiraceae bacterium]|jgi:chemotaxis protein MotB|nr:OmpA family protein [Oscillospiraceae bacterium]